MTWSYSGNPSSSALDEVRFLIQDTVSTVPLLQNEEINYLLVKLPARQAATAACRTLARKFARQPGSRTIGDVTVSYGELSTRYSALAKELEQESASLGLTVPKPRLSGGSSEPASEPDTPHFTEHDPQWVNHNTTAGDGFHP